MENFNTMLNNEEGYTERSYCRKKVYPFSGHWSSVREIIRISFILNSSIKKMALS